MTGQDASVSFVARIWLERSHNGEPMWRGHIKHVQGDEEGYFRDLAEMNEFLERVSGVTGPATSGSPRSHVSTPPSPIAAGKRKP